MFETPLEINAIRLNPDYVAVRAGKGNLLSSFAGRLLAFGAGILRSLVAAPREIASLARGRTAPLICFTSTSNQTAALEPIVGPIDGVSWVSVNQPQLRKAGALAYPSIVVSLVSVLTLPATLGFAVVFLLFRKDNGPLSGRMRALAFSFDEVLRAYAYLAAAHVLLARHRPGAVIMSNDHNAINRALCLAGGRRGVKTVYIQHAPVTQVFPRLVCSHAFLDSEVSAELYRRRPTVAVIEVLGASRYDARFQTTRQGAGAEKKTISLCLNKIDDPARILAYHRALVERGWRVILRPHPGMSDNDLGFLPRDTEIDRAPIHEHLRKVTFLIAGNSGVLLDAYMAGVTPVMATDMSGLTDYYGFLDHRAVYPVQLETLDAFDEQHSSWTPEALTPGMKAFNAAIGTPDMYSVADRIRRRIIALSASGQGQEGMSRD